jgi:hypothetical protein
LISFKDKVEKLKQNIRDSNYQKHESLDRYTNKLIGTMYIKKKMDYGFHLYYIHEPSETNPLAGKNGTVSEMYYDLRNRIYWIKRNLKDVKFSVRNVDSIFPRDYHQRNEIFEKLSTPVNKGLYIAAFNFLGAMGNEVTEMFGRFFHRLITEHSYYELLYKAGVKINSRTYIENRNGNSPREILGLSKTQWKMVSKYSIPIDEFENRNNEVADKNTINYLAYLKSLEEEFGIEKTNDFVQNEFNYLYGGYVYRSALQTASNYDLPIKKFLRYIYFECDVSQGLNSSSAIGEYSDYIRMTTEMGYERFDRYPKFLRTVHDIASRNYKVKLNEIEMKEWQESFEKNKLFEYTYQGYRIFPPNDPSELVREGNVLGHCVGSYVNKVRKGISAIFFLRNRDDIECPLVTIEVKDNRITQAKGKMNNPPTKEQKDIIKKFAKKYELAI